MYKYHYYTFSNYHSSIVSKLININILLLVNIVNKLKIRYSNCDLDTSNIKKKSWYLLFDAFLMV